CYVGYQSPVANNKYLLLLCRLDLRKIVSPAIPARHSRLLRRPAASRHVPQPPRQLRTNPQRDGQFVSYREGHVFDEPTLAPSHPDLAPRNKQWRMHEPKEGHDG